MKTLSFILALAAAGGAALWKPSATPKPGCCAPDALAVCQPYAEKCPACVDCSACHHCSKLGGKCSVCFKKK